MAGLEDLHVLMLQLREELKLLVAAVKQLQQDTNKISDIHTLTDRLDQDMRIVKAAVTEAKNDLNKIERRVQNLK